MARRSPLGIKGTSVWFSEDANGKSTTAVVRAKDANGKYEARSFAISSWRRDGSPVIPPAAVEWAESRRTDFVRGTAVAGACSFPEMARALADNADSKGVSAERVQLIKAIASGLEREGITNMQSDAFASRVRRWVGSLTVNWAFAEDYRFRKLDDRPITAATQNKLLSIIHRVTRLAVLRRRLAFDPMAEVENFKTTKKLKALFTFEELARMVSDEARDHSAKARVELEAAIEAQPGATRGDRIRSLADARGIHWTTIYNRLKHPAGADPWWLPCCLLVYTGCRAQEALHLRWEWIKWDAKVISLKIHPDFDIKADTERQFPLEPELAEILRPIAKPAGWIISDDAIRAGGSGERYNKPKHAGSRDYCDAFRRYLARIGMEAGDRTVHSTRHCFISAKIARQDMNLDRLRKAVGHADIKTTQGYSAQSQEFEAVVDRWPDSSLWLRREVPVAVGQVAR
jgi:integrase